MAYNTELADRIREFLLTKQHLKIEEKKMFRGLTFMVNDKMCVCVSSDNLMCRFDPNLLGELTERIGFKPMIMKGCEYKGYCYVSKDGYKTKNDLEYWLNLCLNFNKKAIGKKK
jgi:hypothetical protein